MSLHAYVLIGSPRTRKSTLLRCLTGCYSRNLRDIETHHGQVLKVGGGGVRARGAGEVDDCSRGAAVLDGVGLGVVAKGAETVEGGVETGERVKIGGAREERVEIGEVGVEVGVAGEFEQVKGGEVEGAHGALEVEAGGEEGVEEGCRMWDVGCRM